MLYSTCPHCQHRYKTSGPVWNEPQYDKDFVKSCINEQETHKEDFGTYNRMQGIQKQIEIEEKNVQGYYSPRLIASLLHISVPSSRYIISALQNANYKYSETHCSAGCIKTDAPYEFFLDIFRAMVILSHKLPSPVYIAYEKYNDIDIRKFLLNNHSIILNTKQIDDSEYITKLPFFNSSTNTLSLQDPINTIIDTNTINTTIHKSPGSIILCKSLSNDIDFSLPQQSLALRTVPVFFPNPEPNWGPKSAAGMFQ